MPEIKLSQGTIQYRDEGTGSPVVLIHGLMVNGQVWDGVVSGLRGRARCIVPDLLKALAAFGRFRFGRAGAMKAMPLTLTPIPDELVKSWVEPLRRSEIRRDVMKVVRGISPEQTLAAAEQLRSFPGQALIIW